MREVLSSSYRSADGSRAKKVAGPHVAAGDGVVDQLLLHRPVHVLKVGAANGLGGIGAVDCM